MMAASNMMGVGELWVVLPRDMSTANTASRDDMKKVSG